MMLSSAITLAAELIVKVTDEGKPVPMAEIMILNSNTRSMINNNFTNKLGIYQYTVKQGLYELRVTKGEFLDVTIKDIEVKNSNINKVVKLVPRAFGSDETAVSSEDDCE